MQKNRHEKCPGTLGLIDNVIVFGEMKREHDQNLHNLMKVAQTEGLCFNSDKCAIDQMAEQSTVYKP